MGLIEAIILGLVQGLTEYLPISSTGHLRLIPSLFGWEDPGAAFSAVIQLGTMLAVIIYFWKDLYNISRRLTANLIKGKFITDQDTKLGWYIIIGTIPIVIFGLLFKNFIENEARSLYIIGFNLIFFAIILFVAEKISKFKYELKDLTFGQAMIMSFAQVLSLIPGASRSGVTITGGLFAGLTRETAARFSFLLSIPAVFTSGLYQLYKILPLLKDANLLNITVATVFSFIAGYWSIGFLLKFLRTRTTFIFIVYRIIVGIIIISLHYFLIIK